MSNGNCGGQGDPVNGRWQISVDLSEADPVMAGTAIHGFSVFAEERPQYDQK